jgi:hypothetical protein
VDSAGGRQVGRGHERRQGLALRRSELRFTDVDDELFPACNAERAGSTYTDEYAVTYICDLVDGLGYCWVQFGRTDQRDPRPE